MIFRNKRGRNLLFRVVFFTMTELCPPDPLTGGYNDITLAPLLYTYDSGDCQQKDQHIFEITHLVCVSVWGGGG